MRRRSFLAVVAGLVGLRRGPVVEAVHRYDDDVTFVAVDRRRMVPPPSCAPLELEPVDVLRVIRREYRDRLLESIEREIVG